MSLLLNRAIILILLFGTLVSCTKELQVSEELSTVSKTALKDSCSYTIDGITYTCDNQSSRGFLNAPVYVYNDTTNGDRKQDPDTTLFGRFFTLSASYKLDSSKRPGYLTIKFLRKYARNQMNNWFPDISTWLVPKDSAVYMTPLDRPYSMDYLRFNRQNGVVIELSAYDPSKSKIEFYYSYPYSKPRFVTTISNDDQLGSTFTLHKLEVSKSSPSELRFLEASFSVNIYDNNDRKRRVTGYIKIVG